MGINGQLSVIILWTALLCCHSNPAKKTRISNKLDHKEEAVNLLFRFTRDAVPTKAVEKNSTKVSSSVWRTLFSNVKPDPTDPPIKSHVTVVENRGLPGSDQSQPSKDDSNKSSDNGVKEQGPKFDDKAIQRAFMVFGGLCAILLMYFGLKYMFRRKRKADGRYGRVDSSEMDLLESNDDIEEEEDDTLFDIHAHTRS